MVAAFRRKREARRNRQTDPGHLRKAGAFAAKQLLHRSVAFYLACAKKINVFHGFSPPYFCGLQRQPASRIISVRVICRRADKLNLKLYLNCTTTSLSQLFQRNPRSSKTVTVNPKAE